MGISIKKDLVLGISSVRMVMNVGIPTKTISRGGNEKSSKNPEKVKTETKNTQAIRTVSSMEDVKLFLPGLA